MGVLAARWLSLQLSPLSPAALHAGPTKQNRAPLSLQHISMLTTAGRRRR